MDHPVRRRVNGGCSVSYDFDQVIDRWNTAASKWDSLASRFGRTDVLPMWVADMDFPSPSAVQEALMRRVQHGVYGYTIKSQAYVDSIVSWMQRRHKWTIAPEAIVPAPGVVPALSVIVQAFTEPGEGVLIQPPVYHPFKRTIASWNRTVIENPLVERNGRYEINFADLEEKARQAKIMFLCSPHNPVGRVWTEDELRRVGEICLRHDVLVVADEIHADLVFAPHRHIPFASLDPSFAARSITCAAPSKTFNLAGLNTAYIIAEDGDLRRKYQTASARAAMAELNVFGVEAMIAAYNHGENWLDDLLHYLAGNLDFMESFLQQNVPEVRMFRPEGTYLVWLDFRALGLSPKELDQFLIEEARLGLNEGHLFGREGEGFQRMNIACPRALLEQGLQQLAGAIKARRKG
ncbi:MalY/PatB family protein [Alicyclobacillus hesperidum]|uniref:MalY/PatB family protein n=1 Tax=Alicyclobacillus hesperidum TaxID=89784 RepID=UPI000945680E|nr:MalY/PatB family protein [Alicyclobacillus hesperidum]